MQVTDEIIKVPDVQAPTVILFDTFHPEKVSEQQLLRLATSD